MYRKRTRIAGSRFEVAGSITVIGSFVTRLMSRPARSPLDAITTLALRSATSDDFVSLRTRSTILKSVVSPST